jgi:hypothetical protein
MRKRNTPYFASLWLLGLILMSADAMGQTSPRTPSSSLPPGVAVAAEATPEIATIGDPIRVDLLITMPEGCHVEIPSPGSPIGDFTILDFFPGPTIPDNGTSEKQSPPSRTQAVASPQHHARIVAAIYKTGTFTVPPFRMKLHTADDKEIEFSSPPLRIEIRSVLNEKNQNLIDLKKQAEITERWPWLRWGLPAACLISAYVLILGIVLWIVLRRKRRRPFPLFPAQVRDLLDLAEADLKNLLARGLPESGREKQFYIQLSEIVKRILEAGYKIPTAEQTTSEIMSSLHKISELEPENTGPIESFLVRCDAVKFAKYIPSGLEHEAAIKEALQILGEARGEVRRVKGEG